MSSKSTRPSPKSLLFEARGVDETFAPLNLTEYESVIGELRRKNYSFAKIADWLAERLNRPVNKGGVYRVYTDWEEKLEREREYRDNSPEVPLQEAISDFASSIISFVEEYEKNNRCSGFADEALEQAAHLYRQQIEDEKTAESRDVEASPEESSTKE